MLTSPRLPDARCWSLRRSFQRGQGRSRISLPPNPHRRCMNAITEAAQRSIYIYIYIILHRLLHLPLRQDIHRASRKMLTRHPHDTTSRSVSTWAWPVSEKKKEFFFIFFTSSIVRGGGAVLSVSMRNLSPTLFPYPIHVHAPFSPPVTTGFTQTLAASTSATSCAKSGRLGSFFTPSQICLAIFPHHISEKHLQIHNQGNFTKNLSGDATLGSMGWAMGDRT